MKKIFRFLFKKKRIKDVQNAQVKRQSISEALLNNKQQQSKSRQLSQLLDRSYDLHLPFGNVPMLPPDYFKGNHKEKENKSERSLFDFRFGRF